MRADTADMPRRIPPERPVPAAKVERMKQRIRENVARNLLRLREEAGLSQRQLSERADVSQTYISQIETGQSRNFGVDLLAALAVALDKTPSDLISD
jgi:ribosome-binding protein aMBF1 (putative translation factor)